MQKTGSVGNENYNELFFNKANVFGEKDKFEVDTHDYICLKYALLTKEKLLKNCSFPFRTHSCFTSL